MIKFKKTKQHIYVERPDPDTDIPSFQTAIFRYMFAKQFVKDKKVLDIGCGYGYGTMLLSEDAKEVIGTDISKDAIDQAKNKLNAGNKNVVFMVMDAENPQFPDGTFDVLVVYEMIEHVDNYKRCLGEMKRVLKPNGLLIISTPKKEDNFNGLPGNPYHKHVFTYSEFESILKDMFGEIEMFHQKSSDKAMESFHKGKPLKRKLAKFDIFNLHSFIPRKFYVFLRDCSKLVG